MSEIVSYKKRQKIIKIGELLENKRKSLGKQYSSREKFIENRSKEIFNGDAWISTRHLANIESGKNWLSVELLIKHSYALEMEPIELFREIVELLREETTFPL